MHGHRPQLDGLRALAVALVVLEHTGFGHAVFPLGIVGVWLFFTLSGFLITGVLLDAEEQGGGGWRGVGVFYARRFFRIFPAYYLALAVGILLAVPGARERWPSYAAYLTNWRVALGDGHFTGATLDHFWSLAVEEQFYLVWPFAVLFLSARWRVPLFILAAVSAPLTRFVLAAAGWDRVALLAPTPCGLDALAVGALAAVGLRQLPALTRKLAGYALPAGLLIVAAAVAADLCGCVVPFARAAFPLGLTLASVFLVVRGAEGFGGVAGQLLSCRPLRYLGRISYGIYLWHQIVIELLLYVMVPNAAAAFAGSVAVAALSWHLIEAPLNGLKRYFPYTRPAALQTA